MAQSRPLRGKALDNGDESPLTPLITCHVAMGAHDLGPGLMDNINANEDVAMRELGDTNDRVSYFSSFSYERKESL